MSAAYLILLLLSLLGVALLDRRWRLFVWRAPVTAVMVLVSGVVFFVLWDLLGIANGHFRQADGPWQLGVLLAPELPIEEPVFLLLLCWCAMLLWCAAARLLEPRQR